MKLILTLLLLMTITSVQADWNIWRNLAHAWDGARGLCQQRARELHQYDNDNEQRADYVATTAERYKAQKSKPGICPSRKTLALTVGGVAAVSLFTWYKLRSK